MRGGTCQRRSGAAGLRVLSIAGDTVASACAIIEFMGAGQRPISLMANSLKINAMN
jgi:hypothetical protein